MQSEKNVIYNFPEMNGAPCMSFAFIKSNGINYSIYFEPIPAVLIF